MNETTPAVVDPAVVDTKHFVIAFDPDGNEVRIEVDAEGNFVQDFEAEDAPTVH